MDLEPLEPSVLSSDYDVGPMSPFDVLAALRAVTTGSLEVGRRADFVVVDRDVFTTDALAATKVLWTVLDGRETWRDPAFSY